MVFSSDLNSYVVRIEINKTYSFPSFFIIQCTRTGTTAIAYYKSETENSAWLRGDTAPELDETVEANSNTIPIYAIYKKAE